MKRILLYIQTASHPIFQKNTKLLVENYNRVIRKYNLNMDVITVTGKIDGREDYFEDFIIDCNETEIAKVNFEMLKVLTKVEGDVIVKTNTATVVNLKLLYDFCTSEFFDDKVIYSNTLFGIYTKLDKKGFMFPSGMFTMMSSKLWRELISHQDAAIEYMNSHGYRELNNIFPDKKHENKAHWCGYSDESLFGACSYLMDNNQHILVPQTSILSYTKSQYFNVYIENGVIHNDVNPTYLCINCKLDMTWDFFEKGSIEEKYRLYYEHHLIDAVCKLFETYEPTYDDLVNLYDNIMYFG